MIESGFNLCEGEYIGFDDIDLRFSAGRERPMQKGRLKAKLDDFETHIIEEALDVSSNLSEAAVQLGISRQTLSIKMKRLDIAERNGRRRRDGKT